MLANQIQAHIKKMIHYYQVRAIPAMQGRSNICKSINIINHINGLKERNNITILKDAERDFEKSQHSFMIKALRRTGLEGTYLNIIKTINGNFIADIILNVE